MREALERHVILRTAWVYSAHGQNFVKTMLRIAAERPVLRVVADQTGSPTSAADIAAAIGAIARQIAAGNMRSGTYHFAGAGAWKGADGADGLTGVSCASASLCVAVDWIGEALIGTRPPTGHR